jgi:hypothetical protein
VLANEAKERHNFRITRVKARANPGQVRPLRNRVEREHAVVAVLKD